MNIEIKSQKMWGETTYYVVSPDGRQIVACQNEAKAEKIASRYRKGTVLDVYVGGRMQLYVVNGEVTRTTILSGDAPNRAWTESDGFNQIKEILKVGWSPEGRQILINDVGNFAGWYTGDDEETVLA